MCLLDEIRAKRDEIYAVARAHKAEKLWVFGLVHVKRKLLKAMSIFWSNGNLAVIVGVMNARWRLPMRNCLEAE